MNQYPQEYSGPPYYYNPVQYSPAQYQVMQWQAIFDVLVGVMVVVAMGAWVLSLVKKAFKGEEVPFPL